MNKLRIGWATRDISTDKPLNLPGQFHMRISKGILDPITVNVCYIENDCDTVIFMSGDLIAVRDRLVDTVKDKVKKVNPDIPVDKLIFNATHTHCMPQYYYEKKVTYPPHDGIEIASSDEYREFLSDMASEAICEAYSTRAPAGIAYGYGYASVAHSRRVMYLDDLSKRPGADNNSSLFVDGHVAMYGDTSDDMFSGYEAGTDSIINIMYTFDSSDKLTGAIINVPCPSQNSEREYYVTADFWHDVRAMLKKKYGDIGIISQCAAAGDLSPRLLHYEKAQKRRYALKYANTEIDSRINKVHEKYTRLDIAERISDAFTEVLSWAKSDIKHEAKICHSIKNIELTKRELTEELYNHAKEQSEELAKIPFQSTGDKYADFKENSRLISRRARSSGVMKRYEEMKTEPKLPMTLHTVAIDDVAFVTNMFELYMDYQHRIQARSPFTQTFIVQLCGQDGDIGGTYLPTQRGVEGKGYSATMFCNEVSFEGGGELVEKSVEELKRLYRLINTD